MLIIRFTGGGAFPLEETDETKVSLYPANARGVLQVIREVRQEKKDIISTDKSYNIDQVLSSEEQQDLEDIRIPSYVFANYRKYYTHYCTLAIDFLKVHWKEQDFMSKISDDWNPLGFSTRRTTASKDAGKACQITDWNTAMKDYADDFGARAFLIRNLPVKTIFDLRMMRFDDPPHQRIPDIVNWP